MNSEKDFVDIWHGNMFFDEAHQNSYWPLLSLEEQNKAKTFKSPELQKKYVYTRATLRKLLSTYVDIQPQALKIKASPHGKPFLETSPIYFNLSHTGNKLVLAISNIDYTGIDIEQYKNRKNLPGLANKCFAEEELTFWKALPKNKQVETFYQFWVKKEAFVKAVGKGISLGLNRCVINPNDQTRFLYIPRDYGLACDWKIVNINLDESHACALAIKNQAFKLTKIDIQ